MTGVFVLLSAIAIPVAAPRAALADHNSMYVVCPDPVPEGNSTRMGIRRSGYKVLEAYAFTDHLYYTADSDDYTEYHGVKFEQSEGRYAVDPHRDDGRHSARARRDLRHRLLGRQGKRTAAW